jgi:DNA-binding NarL/FixJ family response regulator
MPGGQVVGHIRALVVSDLRVYRDGLAMALRTDPLVESVEVAAHPYEAAHRAQEFAPHTVLLDSRTPDAFDVVQLLGRLVPQATVLALGVLDHLVPTVVGIGVAVYLPPEATIFDICAALRTSIYTGGQPGDSPQPGSLMLQLPILGSDLTSREQEVLALIREGLTNKQIGCRLSITTSTVKQHVHSILKKRHADRRTQLIAQSPYPSPDLHDSASVSHVS